MNNIENILKKPEIIFVIIALFFGLLFSVLTPPTKVADENAHLLRSAEVSSGIFYNKIPAQKVYYDKYFTKLIIRSSGQHQATSYSPVLYSIPALAIKIGSLFTENGLFLFYFARFLNMIFWITLTAMAIKITPVFKWLFFFAALLPMTVFEGMSLAADSFNTAFAFLFFAYIFKLIYDSQELKKSDYVKLSLMSILSAFTKGTIYPIFLFIFLPIKKHKYFFAFSCFAIAFALMTWWKSINMTFIFPESNPELHRHLLVSAPLEFVKISARTIIDYSDFYLNNLIGILGWLDIRFKDIVYVLTTIVFALCCLILPEPKIKKSQRILAAAAWIIFTVLLLIMYYIIWTVPGDTHIQGIQGRYFTPILPFLFILFTTNKPLFNTKIQNYFKLFTIIFLIAVLIYASTQIYNHYHFLFRILL